MVAAAAARPSLALDYYFLRSMCLSVFFVFVPELFVFGLCFNIFQKTLMRQILSWLRRPLTDRFGFLAIRPAVSTLTSPVTPAPAADAYVRDGADPLSGSGLAELCVMCVLDVDPRCCRRF